MSAAFSFAVRSALCACCDDGSHFADVLHGGDFAHLEFHAELALYSGDQRDVLQAVPILNVVCGRFRRDVNGVIVKNILKNAVQSFKKLSGVHGKSAVGDLIDYLI